MRIHFEKFNLPHRNNHFWHLIHTSESGKLYYIHTSGVVGVVYKNGKEKLLKGFLHHGKDLAVKIDGKCVKVKNLVAREVFEKYRWGIDSIVLRDGNPRNCDCYNMSIYTSQELGERTGHLHGKGVSISIDNKWYPSIRQAAKANNVSYQTILDKLSGRSKNSVLNNKKIILESSYEKN